MAYGVITEIDLSSSDKHLIGSSLYAECTVTGDTVSKTANIKKLGSSLHSFTLVHGITAHVYFENSNTASSPTLNINQTGAKPIYKYGTTVPGTTPQTSWKAGSIISLTYSTTNNSNGCWVMNDYLDGGSGSTVTALTATQVYNATTAGWGSGIPNGDNNSY